MIRLHDAQADLGLCHQHMYVDTFLHGKSPKANIFKNRCPALYFFQNYFKKLEFEPPKQEFRAHLFEALLA